MPKQSYDLPKLTSYVNRLTANETEEVKQTFEEPVIITDDVVQGTITKEPALEPSLVSASSFSEEVICKEGKREWTDALCDCGHDLKHCTLKLISSRYYYAFLPIQSCEEILFYTHF